MKSVYKVVLAVLAVAGFFFAVQPAVAHHSGAEFMDQVKEITGTIKEFQLSPYLDSGGGREPQGREGRMERRVGRPEFPGAPGLSSVDIPGGREGRHAHPSYAQWCSCRRLRRCEVPRWKNGRQMGIIL